MYKYIFSLLAAVCVCTGLWADETIAVNTPAANDETEMSNMTRDDRRALRGPAYQGFYLCADLFNPLAGFWNGGRHEFEFSADLGLWHRLFPVVETGFMLQNERSGQVSYGSRGFFLRVGAGYNLLNNQWSRQADHAIILGARYCFSRTSYQASGVTIENPYWGESGSYDISPTSVNQGWVEFCATVRTQICKGFFLGLTGRVKAFKHSYENLSGMPAYTAGYGGEDGDSFNFGLSFTACYQFPYKR